MLLPPSKNKIKSIQTQNKRNKKLVDKLGLKLSGTIAYTNAKVAFKKEFMTMYFEIMTDYYKKKKLKYSKAQIYNPKTKSILDRWYDRMMNPVNFPFAVDELSDRELYLNPSFWKSALVTLTQSNSVEVVLQYTQTVNGLFLYVQNGKYNTDILRKQIHDSDRTLTVREIQKLKPKDFKYLFGVYCIQLYEQVKRVRLRRSKVFYKYSGFLEVYDRYPIFKKEMVATSPTFRAALIEFYPYYKNLIKYLSIDDYMQYNELLDYISRYPVDLEYEDAIFTMYKAEQIEDFVNYLVKLILG